MNYEQILGVRFWNGDAESAVETICGAGGLLVVPAAPALVNIQYDAEYRRALTEADLAIADSGAMVLLWKIFRRCTVTRISGLNYLRQLFKRIVLPAEGAVFLILPNDSARDKAAAWLNSQGLNVAPDSFYIAPIYGRSNFKDEALLHLVNRQRPAHIMIGIGGGTQEKLGLYLREHLSYRPAIHCIGAALGFLTGDQKPIPEWADTLYLAWLLRLARDPRRYAKRFWVAHELPGLIARYGSDLPPLKVRQFES